MSHLYKNRLQNYAQKKNLALPTYSCEMEGPPHARRFKAIVAIDEKTYEGPAFYSTLKDAENAVAKVAFESLSPNDVEEDDSLYKSLLQELAQKEGYRIPTYQTVKAGPPHIPTFVSTVTIEDKIFHGQEAKTKKQAEMKAAKVAYASLSEGIARRNSTDFPVGCQIIETSEFPSYSLQSVVTNDMQANCVLNTEANLSTEKEPNRDKGPATCGSNTLRVLEVSSSSLQPVVTHKLQPNVIDEIQLNVRLKTPVPEEQANKDKGVDTNAKRHRSPSPDNGPSFTLGSSTDSVMDSDLARPACQKILVLPQSRMPYADGVVVASDDKWVAMRVGMDQEL